jgi:hypothetical protein
LYILFIYVLPGVEKQRSKDPVFFFFLLFFSPPDKFCGIEAMLILAMTRNTGHISMMLRMARTDINSMGRS